MFLLFPYTLSTLPSFPFIYIPICFYYFCIALFLPLHFSDLHSNMFLLFPGCGISNKAQKEQFTFQYVSIISDCSRTHYCSGKGIYIPICFYYFQNPQWSRQSQYLIYIPICFYYFGFVYRFYDLRVVFTFQYVSIISVRTALTT